VGMLSSLTSSNGYAENYTYNDLSLISKKITTIDGTSYSQDYTYDNLSRLQNYSYPYNSSAEFSLQYQYNTISGDLQKIINTNTSDVIWECSTVNALGQISYYKTSNGIIRTDKIYDPVNHLLTGISSSTGGMVNYKQLLEYTYNSKFQMETRSDNINNITETFTYDKNRLSSSLVTGQSIVETTFEDATGNIEYKTNLGDYDYELAQPHAVNKITPHTGENTIVSTDPQVINYTSFNKVNDITEGDYYMDFVYGADHQRIKTELKNSSGNSLIKQKYFIDNLEIEKNADNLYRKLFYIYATTGIVGIYEMKSTGINKMHYVYTDHLGSYNVITDATGNVEEQLSFDAWGRRRNATDWSYTNLPTTFLFDRGYTGHEHLDVFNLINMNGRMYDPLVGRFLSPDNYTQSATTQGLNRYSYCLNNPLAYTDPSGYLAYGAGYNTGQDLAAINHQLQMENYDWFNDLKAAVVKGGNSISFTFTNVSGYGEGADGWYTSAEKAAKAITDYVLKISQANATASLNGCGFIKFSEDGVYITRTGAIKTLKAEEGENAKYCSTVIIYNGKILYSGYLVASEAGYNLGTRDKLLNSQYKLLADDEHKIVAGTTNKWPSFLIDEGNPNTNDDDILLHPGYMINNFWGCWGFSEDLPAIEVNGPHYDKMLRLNYKNMESIILNLQKNYYDKGISIYLK